MVDNKNQKIKENNINNKNTDKNKIDDTWGIVSISLGIISILFFMLPHLAIAAGVIAIIAYNKQKKIKELPIATAGLITGIIGLVLNTITLLLFVVLFYSIGSNIVNVGNIDFNEVPNLEIRVDGESDNGNFILNTKIIAENNSSVNDSILNNINITNLTS